MHFCAVSVQPCNEEGEVRLSYGDQGRVEICIGDQWGGICGDEWLNGTWGPSEALVTCRQLGFNCKFS